MPLRVDTLTWRLFFRVAPIIIIAIGVIGVLSYSSAVTETNETYDAQMSNNASLLWTLVQDEINEDDSEREHEDEPHVIDFSQDRLGVRKYLAEPDEFKDQVPDHMFRIWRNGRLLMYSNTSFSLDPVKTAKGFSNVVDKGVNWRVLSIPVARQGVLIQFGEKTEIRDDLISEIFLDLFSPLLLLTPVVIVLVWGGIRSGLDKIRELVGKILQRSPDDLSPINVAGLPGDLAPLVLSVNELMAMLHESLEAERRFTDHAAHQLRTPLAGIKLQLQLLSHIDNEVERKATVRDLLASTDRAARHVTQLLRAARITHTGIKISPVSLYDTCASVIAGMGALVTARKMNVSLEGDEEIKVMADDTLLHLMIENIFENALKYTPEGGSIDLHVSQEGLRGVLRVVDSGPGIPESERESVFERFYRIGAPVQEGSGIGLSIVSEIIRRLGGAIALETPENGVGLGVRISIPVAQG